MDNVEKTRKLDLCVSCGICESACPRRAITLEFGQGQFLPKISSVCIKCGECLLLCPGIDINPEKYGSLNYLIEENRKKCLAVYTGYCKDIEIRKNTTSGGIITSLIKGLIENNIFDSAFVLEFDHFAGDQAKLKRVDNIGMVLKSSKSKYIPVSVNNIIETLKRRHDNRKYIIVGTSCQIYGIKKFIERFNISQDNLFFLGLFCDKTMNFNILKFFEKRYKKSGEKLTQFYFRTKEYSGWPGDTKLVFDSGRELILDKSIRMSLKRFFQLNRCLFCLDKLNLRADISFGDYYIKGGEEWLGKSIVIVRTVKGQKIFDSCASLFVFQQGNLEDVLEAQQIDQKGENFEFAKIFTDSKKVRLFTLLRLRRLQGYLRIGQRSRFRIIKRILFLHNFKIRILKLMKRILKGIHRLVYTLIFLIYGLVTSLKPKQRIESLNNRDRDNIIIIGGELFNKGAQAMTFIVVDQLKRRFHQKRIYLFSSQDYKRSSEEKNIYAFEIEPWDYNQGLDILGIKIVPFFKKGDLDRQHRLKQIVNNADFFVDISGYLLSSQWGWWGAVTYILNIAVAKKNSVPYYILPQSIGPFNYSSWQKLLIFPLLKLYLQYPKRIFVRERDSIGWLQRFTKDNVSQANDIVLHNNGFDISKIYKHQPQFREYLIEPKSVGIIPNNRVEERMGQDKLLKVYKHCIERLLENQFNVYILRHSYEDLSFGQKIKALFVASNCVQLIYDDLNAIEFEGIVKQFDFVIASRYHAIVLAYKNAVPALVIGWANKYRELLDKFGQLNYFFDCRNPLDVEKIVSASIAMSNNHNIESINLTRHLTLIKKNNMSDIFYTL